jgi:putative transposase
MQFASSTFGLLLKPIDRRWFRERVEAFEADRYDKSFSSWDHLVALVFAQLSGSQSLRDVVAAWNANRHHHYHLGASQLSRSTLSDANQRRPVELFAALLGHLAGRCGGKSGQESRAILRIIDSTPIPLGALYDCGASNGRIKGLKMHTIYDPVLDRPLEATVSKANVNDIEAGRAVAIEAGATYIFDKGYCSFAWWREIHATQAVFVTRPKHNMAWRTLHRRRANEAVRGDGFTILKDCEVKLASKGDSRLPMPLRLIKVKRDQAKTITILTNDMTRTAVEIAALYKRRWQIELLFRWLKQHLKIKHFLGVSENAIKLQLVAALIAYLLLRIAMKLNAITMPMIRFASLAAGSIFTRRTIAKLDKPPPSNPAKPKHACNPDQLEFLYA